MFRNIHRINLSIPKDVPFLQQLQFVRGMNTTKKTSALGSTKSYNVNSQYTRTPIKRGKVSKSFYSVNKAESNGGFKDIPGVAAPGDKMVLLYTCGKCETRSAKTISKQSYESGVVLVRCGCCQNIHLIADKLGMFEDAGWTVEKLLEGRGENVKYIKDENVFELSAEDIAGSSK